MAGAGMKSGHFSGRIVSLDGLRGVAAMLVAVYHLPAIFGFKITHAYLAVDFFFILSGWVMAYSYEERIRLGMPFREFLHNRFARLYPLYAVALLLALGATLIKSRIGTTSANIACFLPNALMLPCLQDEGPSFPLNGPSWSIFVEVAINLIWFFAVRVGMHTLRWKLALHFFSALMLWGFAVWVNRYLTGHESDDVHEGLLRGLLGFAGGLLLFQCRMHAWILAYFAVLALGVLASFVAGGDTADVIPLGLFVMGVMPATVWLAAKLRPAMLEGRTAAFLGDCSYAIYLLHVPLAMMLQKPLRLMFPGTGISAYMMKAVIFTTILLFVSSMSYRLLEVPARRWLLKRLKRDVMGPAAGSIR
ncbi:MULTISPECIES: acyltransferase [unclassified Janthinobacterium]|uniref:acyltransferase family protein n=1 Tax=unclassified Janthinobacterium TaxID=2610881 RepID=UPI001C5B446A|nr:MULTISPECIES: acyltransferase [unclassified Janthinobacterium]MBW3499766.1 acyltransferase [Janthinobacterium sp. NKUCC08_JDC]MDX8121937.1 acyltransferase [Janthinobacterium sp. GMG2]